MPHLHLQGLSLNNWVVDTRKHPWKNWWPVPTHELSKIWSYGPSIDLPSSNLQYFAMCSYGDRGKLHDMKSFLVASHFLFLFCILWCTRIWGPTAPAKKQTTQSVVPILRIHVGNVCRWNSFDDARYRHAFCRSKKTAEICDARPFVAGF